MSVYSTQLKNVIKFVAIANLLYFGVEFYFALKADSVSLFADSIDFLEDASVNFLILIALEWSAKSRAYLGRVLALLLLAPGLATIFMAISKLSSPVVPAPETLSLVGAGALLVNTICALMLVSYRNHSGSLTKAAFLSARNDVFANIAIIITGFVTTAMQSFWPDFIVGLAITGMNADAAREVWRASKKEYSDAKP